MRVLQWAILGSLAAFAASGPMRAQAPPAADVVLINGDGSTITRAKHIANWRSGGRKQLSNNQHDHHVYVYDNGNVVIVTYIGTTKDDLGGKISTSTVRCADTWVKHDGKWLRVVHANTDIRE